jgi:hypothetical protein
MRGQRAGGIGVSSHLRRIRLLLTPSVPICSMIVRWLRNFWTWRDLYAAAGFFSLR